MHQKTMIEISKLLVESICENETTIKGKFFLLIVTTDEKLKFSIYYSYEIIEVGCFEKKHFQQF